MYDATKVYAAKCLSKPRWGRLIDIVIHCKNIVNLCIVVSVALFFGTEITVGGLILVYGVMLTFDTSKDCMHRLYRRIWND